MIKIPASISIIIPAYNEEANLENAVEQTRQTFKSLGFRYQIIIINDHSQDATGRIADQLAVQCPEITTVHHSRNCGVGGAFRTGLLEIDKKNHDLTTPMDYTILVPADNPLEPADLTPYLPQLGIADIIVGCRLERVGYSPFSRFASFIYNRVLIPMLFNVGVSDVNWIQIYRKDIFGENGISIEHNGIFFLAEILIKARDKGYRIVEVPTKMKRRLHGQPSCSRPPVIWKTFRDMIRFFWRLRVNRITI